MQTIEQALEKLSKSSFRSKFYLKEADFSYIERVGMELSLIHIYASGSFRHAGMVWRRNGKVGKYISWLFRRRTD